MPVGRNDFSNSAEADIIQLAMYIHLFKELNLLYSIGQQRLLINEYNLCICLMSSDCWLKKTICLFVWSAKAFDLWRRPVRLSDQLSLLIVDWRRPSVHVSNQLKELIDEDHVFICLISLVFWLKKTICLFVWSVKSFDWWRLSVRSSDQISLLIEEDNLFSWDYWLKKSFCSFV